MVHSTGHTSDGAGIAHFLLLLHLQTRLWPALEQLPFDSEGQRHTLCGLQWCSSQCLYLQAYKMYRWQCMWQLYSASYKTQHTSPGGPWISWNLFIRENTSAVICSSFSGVRPPTTWWYSTLGSPKSFKSLLWSFPFPLYLAAGWHTVCSRVHGLYFIILHVLNTDLGLYSISFLITV